MIDINQRLSRIETMVEALLKVWGTEPPPPPIEPAVNGVEAVALAPMASVSRMVVKPMAVNPDYLSSIRSFLKVMTVPDANGNCYFNEFCESFFSWAGKHGRKSFSAQQVGRCLNVLGFQRRTSFKRKIVAGLRLRAEAIRG